MAIKIRKYQRQVEEITPIVPQAQFPSVNRAAFGEANAKQIGDSAQQLGKVAMALIKRGQERYETNLDLLADQRYMQFQKDQERFFFDENTHEVGTGADKRVVVNGEYLRKGADTIGAFERYNKFFSDNIEKWLEGLDEKRRARVLKQITNNYIGMRANVSKHEYAERQNFLLSNNKETMKATDEQAYMALNPIAVKNALESKKFQVETNNKLRNLTGDAAERNRKNQYLITMKNILLGAKEKDSSGDLEKELLEAGKEYLSKKDYDKLKDDIEKDLPTREKNRLAIIEATKLSTTAKLISDYSKGVDIDKKSLEMMLRDNQVFDWAAQAIIENMDAPIEKPEEENVLDADSDSTQLTGDQERELAFFGEKVKNVLIESDEKKRQKLLVDLIRSNTKGELHKEKLRLIIDIAKNSNRDRAVEGLNIVNKYIKSTGIEKESPEAGKLRVDLMKALREGKDPVETANNIVANMQYQQMNSNNKDMRLSGKFLDTIDSTIGNSDTIDTQEITSNIYKYLLKIGTDENEAAITANEIINSTKDATDKLDFMNKLNDAINEKIPSFKYNSNFDIHVKKANARKDIINMIKDDKSDFMVKFRAEHPYIFELLATVQEAGIASATFFDGVLIGLPNLMLKEHGYKIPEPKTNAGKALAGLAGLGGFITGGASIGAKATIGKLLSLERVLKAVGKGGKAAQIAYTVGSSAANLGTMEAIMTPESGFTDYKARIKQFLSGAKTGAVFGTFGMIDSVKFPKLTTALRMAANSAYTTIPSHMAGQSIEEQAFQFALGIYFGSEGGMFNNERNLEKNINKINKGREAFRNELLKLKEQTKGKAGKAIIDNLISRVQPIDKESIMDLIPKDNIARDEKGNPIMVLTPEDEKKALNSALEKQIIGKETGNTQALTAEEGYALRKWKEKTNSEFVDIPIFKNSEEAVAFGEKADEKTLLNLKSMKDATQKVYDELIANGEEAKAIKLASGQKQFINEAIKAAEKKLGGEEGGAAEGAKLPPKKPVGTGGIRKKPEALSEEDFKSSAEKGKIGPSAFGMKNIKDDIELLPLVESGDKPLYFTTIDDLTLTSGDNWRKYLKDKGLSYVMGEIKYLGGQEDSITIYKADRPELRDSAIRLTKLFNQKKSPETEEEIGRLLGYSQDDVNKYLAQEYSKTALVKAGFIKSTGSKEAKLPPKELKRKARSYPKEHKIYSDEDKEILRQLEGEWYSPNTGKLIRDSEGNVTGRIGSERFPLFSFRPREKGESKKEYSKEAGRSGLSKDQLKRAFKNAINDKRMTIKQQEVVDGIVEAAKAMNLFNKEIKNDKEISKVSEPRREKIIQEANNAEPQIEWNFQEIDWTGEEENLIDKNKEIKNIKEVQKEFDTIYTEDKQHNYPREWPKTIAKVGNEFFAEVMDAFKIIGTQAKYHRLRKGKYGSFTNDKKVKLKDITNVLTSTHELGHNLDFILNDDSFPSKITDRFDSKLSNRKLKEELRAVSKILRPDLWPTDEGSDYSNKNTELMADYISHYILDKEGAKRLAPNVTEAFEKKLKTNKEVLDIITNLQKNLKEEAPASPVEKEAIEKINPNDNILLSIDDGEDFVRITKALGLKKIRVEEVMKRKAKNIADRIRKLVPNEERQSDLVTVVENSKKNPLTGKTLEEIKKSLTKNEIKAIKLYRAHIERLRQVINEYLRNFGEKEYIDFLENYFIHAYRRRLSDKQKDVIGKWFRNSPNAKRRKISTLEEAMRMELVPMTTTLSGGIELWSGINAKVALNKAYLKLLPTIRNERGLPVIMKPNDAPSDYKIVDYAPIRQYYVRKLKGKGIIVTQGKVAVDPKIKPLIDSMFGTRITMPIVQNLELLNATAKAFELTIGSLFHYQAEFFSAIGALGSIKTIGGFWGEQAKALGAKKNRFGFYHINILKAGKNLINDPKIVNDFFLAGGKLTRISTEGINIIHKTLDNIEKTLKSKTKNNIAQLLGFSVGETKKAYDFLQDLLWDNVSRIKLLSYYTIVAKEMELNSKRPENKKMSVKSIKEAAAKYVNNNFGGQEFENTIFKNPKLVQGLSLGFLSLDWGYGQLATASHLVSFGGKTREQRLVNEFRRRLGAKHFARYAMAITVSTILGNYLMSGHAPWENEPGHKLDIDWTRVWRKQDEIRSAMLGEKNWKERRDYTHRYIKLGKGLREVFGWVLHPIRTFGNKLSPIIIEFNKQAFGHNISNIYKTPWAEDSFFQSEHIWDRIKHFLGIFVPFGLRGNNAFLTFPSSKGMTPYKLGVALEQIYNIRAKDALGGIDKRIWSPIDKAAVVKDKALEMGILYNENKLVKSLKKAAEINKVDFSRVNRIAKGKIKTKLYHYYAEAFKKGDKKKMDKYKEVLYKFGATDYTIKKSLRDRGLIR